MPLVLVAGAARSRGSSAPVIELAYIKAGRDALLPDGQGLKGLRLGSALDPFLDPLPEFRHIQPDRNHDVLLQGSCPGTGFQAAQLTFQRGFFLIGFVFQA